MRIAIRVCVVTWCLSASVPCEAGGFFRRVPEVGEWARYSITNVHTAYPGKPTELSVVSQGMVVVQCVGEEVIDERRYLWIESCYDMKPSPEFEYRSINKVLVPEDELLQGTLTQEDIRGWQGENKSDPVELTFSADDRYQDAGGSTLDFLNAGAVASTAQMSSRTIIISEAEIELTYSEYSPLPTREYENDVMSREVTIWPHDELAFGVASMNYVSHQRPLGDSSMEQVNEMRFDLVETGTGAVSELPDHN